jgi:PhzF family phenazine biosynthesis protein
MGTSHAVFVSLGSSPDVVALRFFTATGELPGCGHGTVAALAFLAERSGGQRYQTVLSASGRAFSGNAICDRDEISAGFDPGVAGVRQPRNAERDLVRESFGDGSDVLADDVWVASLGRARLLVPVASRSALAELTPDLARLRDGCDRLDLLGCYVYSLPSAGGRLAARMFAPAIGVPEDIANANSTACLAAHLAQHGVNAVTVDMGDAVGRPASVTATAELQGAAIKIRVGGTAKVATTRRVAPAAFTELD